jgi:hypothetical protein
MSKVCEKCKSNSLKRIEGSNEPVSQHFRLFDMSICEDCYRYIHATGWKPEGLRTKSERECQWCSNLFIVPMLSEEPDTFCSSECFIASEVGAPFG